MTTKSGERVYLQAVTMIDPVTGWIEVHKVLSAWTDLIFNQVEHVNLVNTLPITFQGNSR